MNIAFNLKNYNTQSGVIFNTLQKKCYNITSQNVITLLTSNVITFVITKTLKIKKQLVENRSYFVMSKKELKTIRKVGNSLGVVLPKENLKAIGIEEASNVFIEVIRKGNKKGLFICPSGEEVKEEKAKTIKRAKKVISEVERVASVSPVEVPAVAKKTTQNINIVFKKEELQTISSIQNYAAANDFECFTRRVNIPTEKLAHAFTFDELTLIKNILFQFDSDTYLETLEEQGLMTQTLVRLADKAKLLVQKYWSDEI